MNSLELFAALRQQSESTPFTDEVRPAPDSLPLAYEPGSIAYVSDCLRRYNWQAYLEITDPKTIVVVSKVDNDAIVEFESILDAYMEAYAPNRPNLKRYIKLVSLYLAFVVKRPLHPPRIMAAESNRSVATKIKYSCGTTKRDRDDRFPICRYCVAYSKNSPKQ